jgi:hypothetical protein
MQPARGTAAVLTGIAVGIAGILFPGPQHSVVDYPLFGLLGAAIGVGIARGLHIIKPPRLSAKIISATLSGALVLKLALALIFDRTDEGMVAATAGFLRDGLWYGIAFAFLAHGIASLGANDRTVAPSYQSPERVTAAAFLPALVGIMVLAVGVLLAMLLTRGSH